MRETCWRTRRSTNVNTAQQAQIRLLALVSMHFVITNANFALEQMCNYQFRCYDAFNANTAYVMEFMEVVLQSCIDNPFLALVT